MRKGVKSSAKLLFSKINDLAQPFPKVEDLVQPFPKVEDLVQPFPKVEDLAPPFLKVDLGGSNSRNILNCLGEVVTHILL